MEAFKDIVGSLILFVLGAGVVTLVFVMYFIPKRDAVKEALNKANFFKLLKDTEAQRREHELQLRRTKEDYEEMLARAKKRDPVEVMNEVAEGK